MLTVARLGGGGRRYRRPRTPGVSVVGAVNLALRGRPQSGGGASSSTISAPRRPRDDDGELPREPGAARVHGAPEGLAVLDRASLGAWHRPREEPVGRASARRSGVVGVVWGKGLEFGRGVNSYRSRSFSASLAISPGPTRLKSRISSSTLLIRRASASAGT